MRNLKQHARNPSKVDAKTPKVNKMFATNTAYIITAAFVTTTLASSNFTQTQKYKEKREDMKQILDDLLTGFDCSNPSELTSHEIDPQSNVR